MSELLMHVGTDLADDVCRCAVAAGYTVTAGDHGTGDWLRADVVVVDDHAVTPLVQSGVSRRRGVLLVCGAQASAQAWQEAMTLGADDGFVLPDEEARLVAALSELRVPARSDGRVVAIVGGHGGAGATTLAAATALAAAQSADGRRVLLIGPDELGAGIDLVLGVEAAGGPRACDLVANAGRLSHTALHDALPQAGRGLSVLAAGRGSPGGVRIESVAAAADAGRAGGDVVVLDAPRTQARLRHELVARADLVVVVTRAFLPSLWAARATCADIAEHVRGELGVVVRGPVPSGIALPELAWAVGAELLASYRADPSLPSRLDTQPLRPSSRSPLGAVAARICARLAEVAP